MHRAPAADAVGDGLHVCTDPSTIERLEMSRALNSFRPADKQHVALVAIAADPGSCVSLFEDAGRLIAYAAFHPPAETEARSKRARKLIELGAVEVDPAYRGRHLAKRLLAATFATARFDEAVVFAALYAWHYDRRSTGLGDIEYRRMLEDLYGSVGMHRVATNDPDMRGNPANALLAYIGPNCASEVVREFDRLRLRQASL